MRTRLDDQGFTIAEMAISTIVVSIVALSVIGLFTSLVGSSLIAKRKAVASTLATNQMEYIKSLPYDSLAVAGGSIYSANPLPATTSQTIDNVKYSVKTSISYVDDAFDGCGSYPTQLLKTTYCRNYPPPVGAPATDTNPQDYKIVNVSVSAFSILAAVDTQISARVAETASTTGALFTTVIDDSGNPVSGANVQVVNNSLSPAVNLNDSTDENGVAIFYGLPPDSSGNHYNITASLAGYSTLTTIVPNGALQPNFSNQNILTQQSSSVTLVIMPQGANSLLVEATDTSGAALANLKVYTKGGYKKYTSAADTSYYFDNMSPSDTRPTTDSGGLATISNLVPGNKWGSYIFCGDAGATNCKIGNTTYYLAAAIPYTSTNSFNPVFIPNSTPAPTITYSYNGNAYLQKVRLMLTTDSGFPRVNKLIPSSTSLASGANNHAFQISGTNLPCNSNPASCGTVVKLTQGANTFTASCTGTDGLNISCSVDLSAASQGSTQLLLTANGKTLAVPASLDNGGIDVGP